MKKLAVFFPGIGYTVDKPLMHYARRLAANAGYEIRLLPYAGFPDKIIGDRDRMTASFAIAYGQAEEMLKDLDFSAFEEILFVGKSIGTVVAAKMASESKFRDRIRLILYTPLPETFSLPFGEAVAFTGGADQWVGKEKSPIPKLCRERGIPVTVIPGANHSLETGEVGTDIRNMEVIMEATRRFMTGEAMDESADRS